MQGAEEDASEEDLLAAEVFQVGVVTFSQLVADAEDGAALAGVAEGFRAGDHQDVVVGLFAHGWLEGFDTGVAVVLAEVHAKVGEVFHHDDVVFVGHFADDA